MGRCWNGRVYLGRGVLEWEGLLREVIVGMGECTWGGECWDGSIKEWEGVLRGEWIEIFSIVSSITVFSLPPYTTIWYDTIMTQW